MERIVPWEGLKAIIEPHYPKGEVGRRPIRLDLMIRIHLLQQWYDLSDPGVEEALYDVLSMQRFAGIDLGTAPAPDETTICKFRHLLEKHDLGKRMFEEINAHLERNGVKIGTGTIVDATIINAPSSTVKQPLPPCACGRMKRPRSKRLRANTSPRHPTIELDSIAAPPAEHEKMTGSRFSASSCCMMASSCCMMLLKPVKSRRIRSCL